MIAGEMARVGLSASDRGTTVRLNVGDELTVTLPEDSGGGYLWEVDAIDGAGVAFEKSEPGPPPAGRIGGQRPRELQFRAVGAGSAEIHLAHRRAGGEPELETDRFDVSVVAVERR